MGESLKTIQFCVLKIRNYYSFKFLTLTLTVFDSSSFYSAKLAKKQQKPQAAQTFVIYIRDSIALRFEPFTTECMKMVRKSL